MSYWIDLEHDWRIEMGGMIRFGLRHPSQLIAPRTFLGTEAPLPPPRPPLDRSPPLGPVFDLFTMTALTFSRSPLGPRPRPEDFFPAPPDSLSASFMYSSRFAGASPAPLSCIAVAVTVSTGYCGVLSTSIETSGENQCVRRTLTRIL